MHSLPGGGGKKCSNSKSFLCLREATLTCFHLHVKPVAALGGEQQTGWSHWTAAPLAKSELNVFVSELQAGFMRCKCRFLTTNYLREKWGEITIWATHTRMFWNKWRRQSFRKQERDGAQWLLMFRRVVYYEWGSYNKNQSTSRLRAVLLQSYKPPGFNTSEAGSDAGGQPCKQSQCNSPLLELMYAEGGFSFLFLTIVHEIRK